MPRAIAATIIGMCIMVLWGFLVFALIMLCKAFDLPPIILLLLWPALMVAWAIGDMVIGKDR